MSYLDRLAAQDGVGRLWRRDPSLFSEDAEARALIADRMGWLGLAERIAADSGPWLELRDAWGAEGVEDILLLGMGGSSLAPLVLDRVLRGRDHRPRLRVLDTTSPEQVTRMLRELSPQSTALLLASKSGGTIEPNSLYAIFRSWLDESLGTEAGGARCSAVTDPGTSLEQLARDAGFRATFLAPPDIGGRFSALSVFGMLPAALIGIDLTALAARAVAMEEACRAEPQDNPGAVLGAWIAENHDAGRDKLTLAMSPAIGPFALWIEQLIAESTGKEGRGVLPVIEYESSVPTGYGEDRMIVVNRTEDDMDLAEWAHRLSAHVPVLEHIWSSPMELGGEFVRWEVATALAAHLMGIEPFDQANVAEAKKATADILSGEIRRPAATIHFHGAELAFGGPVPEPASIDCLGDAFSLLIDTLEPGDYLAVLAYLPEDEELLRPLRRAVAALTREKGNAVCLQLGPRYLHSTGQYHKGGPERGSFLVLTAREGADVAIPGRAFTLRELNRAQAEGDMVTLAAHGRPVLRIDIPRWDEGSAEALANALFCAED